MTAVFVRGGDGGGDATRRLDRTIAAAVAASRVFALTQSVAVARTARRQVARPKLLAGGVVGLVAHSAWAMQRGWRRGSIRDPALAWSDGIAQCFALAVEAASWGANGTAGDTRWSETFGAVFTSWLAFEDPSPVVLGGSLLGWLATNAATVVARPAGESPTARGRRVNEAAGHVAFTMLGRVLARAMSTQAVELDVARAAAVDNAEQLAAERERDRQRRNIHDSALQILEAVAGGWAIDDDLLLRRIDYETARLRRLLGDASHETRGLDDELAALVDEFALSGLEVVLDAEELRGRLPRLMVEGLADAAHEALTNVAKHAGVPAAQVVARSTEQGVEVEVLDAGRGFDPALPRHGFGVTESIEARMRDVGGRAVVESSPGSGTRVRLTVPA